MRLARSVIGWWVEKQEGGGDSFSLSLVLPHLPNCCICVLLLFFFFFLPGAIRSVSVDFQLPSVGGPSRCPSGRVWNEVLLESRNKKKKIFYFSRFVVDGLVPTCFFFAGNQKHFFLFSLALSVVDYSLLISGPVNQQSVRCFFLKTNHQISHPLIGSRKAS